MDGRAGAASRALRPVWVALALLRAAGAQKLPGHSIEPHPNLHSLAADWYMAGSAVPTQEGVILQPGVVNRAGALWSSYPLLTNNFEVALTLKARRWPTRASKEAGFALWISPENATAALHPLFNAHGQNQEKLIADTWAEEFLSQKFDLFAYRSNFNGLGVIFLESEDPSISVVANDGSKHFKVNEGLPTANAVKYNWLTDGEITVKVRIHPDKAIVEVPGHKNVEVKHKFPAGTYVGLSTHGGMKVSADSPEKSCFIQLNSLHVINHDTLSKGEEVHETSPPPPPVPQGEKVDVLADSSSFKDHRAESDAIKDLTNMVFKLVVETQPIRQQMSNAIETLSKRIELMENNFEELKQELDKKTGHKLGAEFDAIKHELTSLSSVASKQSMERHSRLEKLHMDIADVHKSANSPDNIDKHLSKLSDSNTKVLDQLNNEHQKMFGVSIAAIAFIIIAGLSLYNKFRCWEKKHVL